MWSWTPHAEQPDADDDDAASVASASSTFSRATFMNLVNEACAVGSTSFDDSTNMISHGDLSRIEVMAENSANASRVRAERLAHRQMRGDAQHAHSTRAGAIRRDVSVGRDHAAFSVSEVQERAWQTADGTRARSSADRARRRAQQQIWWEHGQQLARGARSARARVRREREQLGESRRRDASGMAEELRTAAAATRARMAEARARTHGEERARRESVRASKQHAANMKWDEAEAVRQQEGELKRARRAGEIDYLERALEIKADVLLSNDSARAARAREREALTMRTRTESRLAKEECDAMRTYVLALKRDAHNAVADRRAITSTALARELLDAQSRAGPSPDGGAGARTERRAPPPPSRTAAASSRVGAGPPRGGAARTLTAPAHALTRTESDTSHQDQQIAMLTRFFGFRRRGAGRAHTSATQGSVAVRV